MATNTFSYRRPRRSGLGLAVLLSLLALFRVTAQMPQYPFAPGVLDRIEVIVETYGSSLPFELRGKTTNVLAPNAAFMISDSTFPNGQSFKVQHPNQPPVQPLLNGSLRFNFPAVTPTRDFNGLFQPPMRASVTLEGAWSKTADFGYGAARLTMGSIQPTACPNPETSRIKTGPPIATGTHPVSVASVCDLKSLSGLGGNNPVEQEQVASVFFEAIAGDGGLGDNPIFLGLGSQTVAYAIYKSRRRPEIRIPQNTLSFAYTNGLPLPPAQIVTLTNTGGLPLTWTTAATNHNAPGGPVSWVKFSPASGTLASLGEQPLQVSFDTAGLAPGDHAAKVTIAGDNWDGPKTFFVTLKLTAEQSVSKLEVTPGSLEFFNRVALPQQTLSLSNAGPHLLEWFAPSVRDDDLLLFISPQAGSLNPSQAGTVTVTLFPRRVLPVGQYSQTITFKRNGSSANTAAFPSVTIPVIYNVLETQDELAILAGSVAPSTSEPILLDTEYTNFRADVSYQLGTRTDADLALRLFDEEGNLQASSDFIRVSKSDGLVASRRLTIPEFKLTAPLGGTAPQKLILRAVLIDRSLLTSIKVTSDTDHVFAVRSPVKLTLGLGAALPEFQPAFPAEVRAFPGRLSDQEGWPLAAVVELPKSGVPRILNLTARLFRDPGLSRFYTSLPKVIPPGFEGRVILDLTEIGFRNFPDETLKQRADFVQFRANAINANTEDLAAGRIVGVASQPVTIPVERINLVAAEPPFGSTLPRSEPAQIKLTAEHNVPNFGLRKIHQLIGQEDPSCVRPEHPVLQEGVLGPGRGQFTYEVTAFFPIISETRTGFSASILMRGTDGEAHARDCDDSHSFNFSDRVTLPATPDQTVAAADATVKIVSNPSAAAVEVSAPRKSLAAVAAEDGAGVGAAGAVATWVNQRIRRQALEPFAVSDVISLNQIWHFTPGIAAGRGFNAELTLAYTPVVVPDDPNFSEAALQVISLDPATGALRTYATTVDPARRTATARIDSLAAYYTLGVVGPFARRVVNFPLLQGASDLTARIVANAGDNATSLALTAFDAAGRIIEGEGVSNPVTANLAVDAVFTKSVAATFGIFPQVQAGWIQGVADRGAVGLLLLARTNVADLLAAPTPFPRLLVPGVEHDAVRTTELHVANPTVFQQAVTLELHDGAGAVVGTFSGALGPKATLSGLVGGFFPGLVAAFTGYVVVQGDNDLVALGLVNSATSLAAIGGQPVRLASSTRLVAPGFATGGADHRARLSLVNPGPQPASVTLRAVGDNGADLAAPLNVNLAAGQQYRAELGQAFGLNAAALTTGSLIVEGSVGGLMGELTLFDASASDRFRASLPLLGEPATHSAFAYLDSSSGRFTGLSVHNPNASSVAVTVTVFRPDGSTIGTAPLTLAANARTTRKLAELVGASAGLAGGSFGVESGQPVFASALTGEDSLAALMAIPVHATTATVAMPPALAFTATPSQIVLSWPANATGSVLQSSTSLSTPIIWQPVAGPIVTAGDRKSVTVDFSAAAGFFRLVNP